ncbi:MAG: tetratricopeptide repeat protein [Bryobacterales bacterium]|nr:tetratricopeptide repeat protein [Bryobacterales bacterium]
MFRSAVLLVLLLFLVPSAYSQTFLVAPLENRSRNSNLDWIGESIAESIRAALLSSDLAVLSREERESGIKRLSLKPGAPLSFASLIKLTENLDAMLETLVSYRVVRFLVKDFQLSREEFERRHPPLKLTAKEYYVRGLMASSKEARHRYFAQAVRLEPSFAQPCFYLGRMQWDMDNYRVAAGWLERISPEQEHYWEAQFFLGLSRYQSANFEAALEAFRRLAARRPLPEVVNNLGAVELALDLPDALTHFNAALASDPSDPDYHFNVAYTLWRRGDFAAAAQGFRAVLDRVNDDQDAILLLGRSLKESGPRQGELRLEGLERLKEETDLSGFRASQPAK